MPMNDDTSDGRIRMLVDACHRSARTYLDCARRSQRPELKNFLEIHANGCLDAAQSLAALLGERAGPATAERLAANEPSDEPSDGPASDDELALLEICEQAADEALDRYDEALQAGLAASARSLVTSQHEGALRTHDQIRALRDRALADREAAGRSS
jgi:hypothetical protein